MKVISSRLPFRRARCVATIGVFDGIHRGHQFILGRVKAASQKSAAASLLITFDTPPQQFLNKNQSADGKSPAGFAGLLTDKKEKVSLVSSLGLDYLWLLKTSSSLLKLSPGNFISYIQKHFRIEKLIVGEDFRFGHRCGGNLKSLKKLAGEHGFIVSVIKKKSKNKQVISSSLIRRFIQRGRLKEAALMLGRNFSLKGRVSKGAGRGSRLGFPTANISVSGYVAPQAAVYAAYAVLGRKVYPAAVNVGLRPTFSRAKTPIIEAHILHLRKNILGEVVKIVFLEKLRQERKFPHPQALKTAISKDIRYLTSKYSAP